MVSPVTGQIDAYQWRVPVAAIDAADGALMAERTERLLALGAPKVRVIEDVVDIAPLADPETTIRTIPADTESDPELATSRGRPSPVPMPQKAASRSNAPAAKLSSA
jgi:uncharacterized membrane-anchored protein